MPILYCLCKRYEVIKRWREKVCNNQQMNDDIATTMRRRRGGKEEYDDDGCITSNKKEDEQPVSIKGCNSMIMDGLLVNYQEEEEEFYHEGL